MKRKPIVNRYAHTRRNQVCPCGSGKKFKVCCLRAYKDATAQFEQEVRTRMALKEMGAVVIESQPSSEPKDPFAESLKVA